MNYLKNHKIIIVIILLIMVFLIFFFFFSKDRRKEVEGNNVLNFRIIDNNKTIDENYSYYLYSDNKNMYYLKGKDPNNIFILISNIGVIDDNIYDIAVQKFQNGQRKFEIEGNNLRMNNVKYSLYSWELTIDEFLSKSNYVEIVPYKFIDYKVSSYTENSSKNRQLYYTDKNGVKIYNENVKNLEIIDDSGEILELSKFLEKYNLPSDNVYDIFEMENSTMEEPVFLLSDSTKPTMIKATQYKNLKVSCYYEYNEIYYVISYEKERTV